MQRALFNLFSHVFYALMRFPRRIRNRYPARVPGPVPGIGGSLPPAQDRPAQKPAFHTMPTEIGRQESTFSVSFLTGGDENVEAKKRIPRIPKCKQIPGRKTGPQKKGDEAVSNRFSRKGRADPKLHPANGMPRTSAAAIHHVQTERIAGAYRSGWKYDIILAGKGGR